MIGAFPISAGCGLKVPNESLPFPQSPPQHSKPPQSVLKAFGSVEANKQCVCLKRVMQCVFLPARPSR